MPAVDPVSVVSRVPTIAQSDVQSAVARLSREPGVRRIWLFGSLARNRAPDFRSDIDLAIEGLPRERLLTLWAELDEILRLPPDLVRWEEANPTLRAEIERWGIVIHEQRA
jgi:predicted nucleotidyltransferase